MSERDENKNPIERVRVREHVRYAAVITSFFFLSFMKEKNGSRRFLSCEIALVHAAIRSRRLIPFFFHSTKLTNYV